MDSPWPFAAWGMDVIGPIENAASKGHLLILAVIDYITKSVKASTFGILESIVTNNAANHNSDLMREICEKLRIVHRNSTAHRPRMNGAVEAANKTIKRRLLYIYQCKALIRWGFSSVTARARDWSQVRARRSKPGVTSVGLKELASGCRCEESSASVSPHMQSRLCRCGDG
uniref:Integrase catalytic domain-containing protein n=1 Tax=Nicotiana tabacum TaxID=4097 RepID=A0A1S3Z4V7_TOBAC|nr:PREDICTED: uncharacterized protein LOC107782991 [Nicotiana tabacum]